MGQWHYAKKWQENRNVYCEDVEARVASVWLILPAVASFILLLAGSAQAQNQPAPANGSQTSAQTAGDPLRREAEEKYRMNQIGDKIQIPVCNSLRNRMINGKLTQIRPTGVVVDSIWIARVDINEDLQTRLFQDKHDEMVAKYIRTNLATKKAEADVKMVAIPPSHLIETLDGKSYDKSKVMKTEPDGLTFETDFGLKKVPFEQLSKEVQSTFGYDKKIADAYRTKVAKAKVAQAHRNAEQNRTALARQEAERQGTSDTSGSVSSGSSGGVGDSSRIVQRGSQEYNDYMRETGGGQHSSVTGAGEFGKMLGL